MSDSLWVRIAFPFTCGALSMDPLTVRHLIHISLRVTLEVWTWERILWKTGKDVWQLSSGFFGRKIIIAVLHLSLHGLGRNKNEAVGLTTEREIERHEEGRDDSRDNLRR